MFEINEKLLSNGEFLLFLMVRRNDKEVSTINNTSDQQIGY